MNVVVVGGVCVDADAISDAMVSQARILSGIREVRSVTIVTHHCGRETSVPVIEVPDSWSFLKLTEVVTADLIIFHWGIHYAIFDALALVADTTRTVVHFHNVTPPGLAPPHDRLSLERSIEQIQLLHEVSSEIWTVSEFNADTLVSWGIDRNRVAFMPFPIEAPRPLHRQDPTGEVQLLCVGRLTAAKGTDVLLDATEQVVRSTSVPIRLTIVGNPVLSDNDFQHSIESRLSSRELRDHVHIVTDADDDALWALFEAADIVVSPSLHEGLCVPVIEGYVAGCRVIGTDGGNLPYVVRDPDPIVPAGDASALAEAMLTMIDEVHYGLTERPPGADQIVEAFSYESTLRRLRMAIESESDRQDYARNSWMDSGMARRTVVDA